jgi:hypothetical protein
MPMPTHSGTVRVPGSGVVSDGQPLLTWPAWWRSAHGSSRGGGYSRGGIPIGFEGAAATCADVSRPPRAFMDGMALVAAHPQRSRVNRAAAYLPLLTPYLLTAATAVRAVPPRPSGVCWGGWLASTASTAER